MTSSRTSYLSSRASGGAPLVRSVRKSRAAVRTPEPAPTLHDGAREHYVHADAYDARYAARSEDRDFYLRLARGRRRILEYGAGTGRITIPLARGGARVVGVDASREMLDVLEERSSVETPAVRARLTAHVADMRTFATRERFDLVIAGFHTLCHLYSRSDVRGFLRQVARHLEPGGIFAFDVPMPRVDLDDYDPIAQVRITHMDGPAGAELLTLRLFQPEELAMHLRYAGFSSVRLFADFARRPLDDETDVVAVVAAKSPLAEGIG